MLVKKSGLEAAILETNESTTLATFRTTTTFDFRPAFATILPDIIREALQSFVISRVIVKCAFVVGLEQTRIDKPFQMMAERRRGQVDVGLNVPRTRPVPIPLHHESQDLQTQRVTQRAKLRCVSLEL